MISGMRADFLDDREQVQSVDWFGCYLEDRTVEFYIEGSGFYVISNIDLVSQEIYLTKLELATRPENSPLRLSSSQFKKIRKSLIYIADLTAVAKSSESKYNLLPSPHVCLYLSAV